MSSIRELKQYSKARQIVKHQLAKLKVEDEKVNPALVQVEYQVDLDDNQFVQEKLKLKNNLSQVMVLAQAEEIVNDATLINKNNIYMLNRTWDQFIQGVTKDFKNLTFNTFRTILSTYLRRLDEPNDQQAQLNALTEIIDTLRYQAMTVDGLARRIEEIINILENQYVRPEKLQEIQRDIQEKETISQADLQKIFRKVQGEIQNPFPDNDEIEDEEEVDTVGEMREFGRSRAKSFGDNSSAASSSAFPQLPPPGLKPWQDKLFKQEDVQKIGS